MGSAIWIPHPCATHSPHLDVWALLDARMLDALPALISYIGTDERYRFVNQAYERWFGVSREDIIGQTVREVVGDEAYPRLLPWMQRAIAGETVTCQLRAPYRHGGERFVEATYIPDIEPTGAVGGVIAMIADISERQRAEERFQAVYCLTGAVISAQRPEQIFDAALDAIEKTLGATRSSILCFDSGGVMRFRAWRGLSDEYRAAVEGHSPWSPDSVDPPPVLIPDAELAPELAPLLPVLRREGIASLAFIPLVSGGRLLGKFMVYYDRPRELGPADLALARTIASHVSAAVARFATVAELQETIRVNDVFTGVLGHDLRNPLSAILTAAQLALTRDESETLAKPLSKIVTSAHRMARMIEQLLDFTRIRMRGGLPLDPGPTDLVAVLRQVIDELDGAGTEAAFDLRQRGDAAGVWDDDRMCQAFSNLVGNAVQHGRRGGPVTVSVDGTNPASVQVDIHNDGQVPADLLAQIFEHIPLDRMRHSRQGLGLGLIIARQIVLAHGGRIAVRSDDGAGTTFTVILPREAARSRSTVP
jgi:PAS domain S-box-containing protein